MQNIENKFYTTIYILMGLSMLSWAVAWTSAKIVNNYLSFYNLVFFRFLLGFISLIPLIAGKYFFSLFKLNKINLLYIIITSILFFVYNVCFFMGTHYGFAGKGAILVTTINPLITALIISMIKNKKGSILYISSTSALDGNEGRSAYSSAKSALITQSKVLSREVGVHNIRVNTIAPGLTDTDMMRDNTPKEKIEEVLSKVSLRRVAIPEEIANIALFLSSDLSSYLTGQVIRVDGGM